MYVCFVCVCVYLCVCMFVCVRMFVCVCMFVCVFVCVDLGAFKKKPTFPPLAMVCSYLVRLLHPSGRVHLAALILRGMLTQSYAPVANASSATNLSSPIRLSPYYRDEPLTTNVKAPLKPTFAAMVTLSSLTLLAPLCVGIT